MSKAALKGHASGSGIVTLEAPNTNTDRTLVLPDVSGTLLSDVSPVVRPRGIPLFSARPSGVQSIPNGVWTKLTLATEDIDTHNFFASSRFTPQEAGWYLIQGAASGNWSGSAYVGVSIAKNGSNIANGPISANAGPYDGIPVSRLVYFNGTTDYVELFCIHNAGAAVNTIVSGTIFHGHLVRAD